MSSVGPREFTKAYFVASEFCFWALRVAVEAGAKFTVLGRPLLRVERGEKLVVLIDTSFADELAALDVSECGVSSAVYEPGKGTILTFDSTEACEAFTAELGATGTGFDTHGILHVEKNTEGVPFTNSQVNADIQEIITEIRPYCEKGNALRMLEGIFGPALETILDPTGNSDGLLNSVCSSSSLSAEGEKILEAWTLRAPQYLITLPGLGPEETTDMIRALRDQLFSSSDLDTEGVLEVLTDMARESALSDSTGGLGAAKSVTADSTGGSAGGLASGSDAAEEGTATQQA